MTTHDIRPGDRVIATVGIYDIDHGMLFMGAPWSGEPTAEVCGVVEHVDSDDPQHPVTLRCDDGMRRYVGAAHDPRVVVLCPRRENVVGIGTRAAAHAAPARCAARAAGGGASVQRVDFEAAALRRELDAATRESIADMVRALGHDVREAQRKKRDHGLSTAALLALSLILKEVGE